MSTGNASRKRKVLLVSDKGPVGELIAPKLADRGLMFNEVTSYGQYDEIFQELNSNSYGLVIATNQSLTPMNLLEVVPRIRKEYPGVKILVMSGYSEPVFLRKMKRSGEDAFMPLPFEWDDFLATVDKLFAS